MTDASQTASALLTEHLQYTPLSLIDDIINSVNDLVYQGVGSLETGLTSTPPERLGYKVTITTNEQGREEKEFPEAKQEIEEGLHKLETLLNSTIDKNFDKFEIYVLRNILSVPADLVNWVRLTHYENVSYPPAQDAAKPEDIQQLRRKLAASRTVSRALLEEHQRNAILIRQLKDLAEGTERTNLSFLTNASMQASQSLASNTSFVLSQMPALRSLLADLRPKLAALHASRAKIEPSSAKDEIRQDRRGYIEQRTRAHLERHGQGMGSDDPVVGGRRVDPEEVQALEKAASIFDPT
ncbi:hypothetical protein B0A52_06054 [Exophiala mesophila]|uniref:Mis12 domain-containing protein n=1 Tax=Exophiala mesophila TaxID=212818 RepID=A0A438N585_EXOME|nr:hypothetical protein B0A52_06054 [Exophiala mesophila]